MTRTKAPAAAVELLGEHAHVEVRGKAPRRQFVIGRIVHVGGFAFLADSVSADSWEGCIRRLKERELGARISQNAPRLYRLAKLLAISQLNRWPNRATVDTLVNIVKEIDGDLFAEEPFPDPWPGEDANGKAV